MDPLIWYFLASMTVSWVLTKSAMDAARRAAEDAKGLLANKDSNIASIPVIYGERKVGGTRVFIGNSGSDNTFLYIILILCEGEINSIGDIYIDDDLSTDSKFSGLVTVNKYLGTDTQSADQTFINANIGWTDNHRLRGTAYVAVKLKWDSDVFSSIPTINAIVQGKKVFTGSIVEYSSNPAWCWRDYMTNTRYGKGLDSSVINDTLVSAAATKCDLSVTPYGGGTSRPIFSCNAVIDTESDIFDNVKVLLSGMRGLMPYQDGKYGLIIEDAGSSTFSFNTDNIFGSFSITSESKKTRFNKIIATYTNPLANWQEDQVQFPVAGNSQLDQYLSEDGNTVLENRISLPTITDKYTALDIAEIALLRSRNGIIVSFTATSEALNVIVGQIVDVTHPTPGWSSKLFRVTNLMMATDGTVSVELIEHQDGIYPWVEKTQAVDIPDTNLPNPFSVVAPTPVSISEELYTTVNSKGTQSRAIFMWAAPSDAFVSEYEAQYKLSSASEFVFITKTSSLSARIEDVPVGLYDFRVRSINSMNVKSAWAQLSSQPVAGLTAPPADLSNFSMRALDGQAHISWSRITDLDVINGGYVRIRHTNVLSGAQWQDGNDIGEAISGTQTHSVLPMLPGTYMAKAVDEGGRFSVNAKLASSNVPNIMDFNSVVTVTEHPLFTGAKTDMSVVSNVLQLDAISSGVIEGSGAYYFANSVDLGGSYTSRVTANLSSSTAISTDLFDSRVANIDSWENFDGEPSDQLSATLQMRIATVDDPLAGPVWSDWSPFLVGDYFARFYEFRVVVTNDDANYNISITALSVTVDMPDRTERAFDVTTAANGSGISFAHAFHAKPSVGITMQDANTGDYFRVTNNTRTGFTVQCFNSANTGIVRSINWIATSYGKEI